MEETGEALAAPLCPVVGVGASAGGLEALLAFVGAIGADCPLAFVIVQHLAPDHRSLMAELLTPHSTAAVIEAEDGTEIEAATVYVMPSGTVPRLEGGTMRLDRVTRERGLRTPIDRFFFSLADARGPGSMCVVLSGTGSDGTTGLRAIKAAGGVALAQDRDSAQFAGMPDSAVSTGLVDIILPPEEMPARLMELAAEAKLQPAEDADERETAIAATLPRILVALKAEGEHSLDGYRTGTLIRRTARRMGVVGMTDPDAYLDYLTSDESERGRLLDDFLVSVTTFFRDPDAFDTLERQVIPELLSRGERSVRLWVPGCSTGEEVFGLAMLVVEQMEARDDGRLLQIFGTDIDRRALAHARAGVYSDPAVERVSPERRQRFMVEHPDGWKVKQRLLNACIFAPHDVIRDPPFSRLDLISCRNLLIYLNPQTQQNVLSRFHYALSEKGFLFLGRAEAMPPTNAFFNAIDSRARLFRRADGVEVGYSALDHKPRDLSDRTVFSQAISRITGHETALPRSRAIPGRTDVEAGQFFLHTLAPPFCIVDRSDSIVHLSDAMTALVRPSPGAPSPALQMMLGRTLRLPVSEALERARASGAVETVENVALDVDGQPRIFDVSAVPAPLGPGTMMVSFAPVRVTDPAALAVLPQPDADRLAMERELALTRQRLAMLEAEFGLLEAEMQSGHDSLLSMNEELQTANQEMEVSREELQSLNEELETINAELQENNDQLQQANNDLENLFGNSDVALLFLDERLRVRRFTRSTKAIISLSDRDTGRPLSDLSARLDLSTLSADAETVDRGDGPLRRELEASDTVQCYMMRLRPYRTADRRLQGYVLSFVDITEAKAAERRSADDARRLAEQFAELEAIYDTAPVGLALQDRDLRWVRINRRLAEINGFEPSALIGQDQAEILPDIHPKVSPIQEAVFRTGEPRLGNEVIGSTPAEPGQIREWIVDYHPVKNGDEVFAIGAVVRDVTEERALRRSLQVSEAKLLFALASGNIGMWEADADGGNLSGTAEFEAIMADGGKGGADTGRLFAQAAGAERAIQRDALNRAISRRERWQADFEIESASGARRQIALAAQPLDEQTLADAASEAPAREAGMTPAGKIVGIVLDITAERASKRQSALMLRELQHRVKNTLATILAIVRFTERASETTSQMGRSLEQRLTAISRTHDVLTRAAWRGDTLRGLFDRHMQPYGDGSVDRTMYLGPDIELGAQATLAMSLAFHELATNAAKHGALSVQGGAVELFVERDNDGRVRIEWRERGGPPVRAPDDDNRGFGSFLVERALAVELDGESTLHFDADGLRCVITFDEDVVVDAVPETTASETGRGSP